MILHGTLLNPVGTAYANASVRLVSVQTSSQVLQSVYSSFKTDAIGAYSFDCPIGRYRVQVSGLLGVRDIGIITVTSTTALDNINALLMLEATVIPRDPLLDQVDAAAAAALASENAAVESAISANGSAAAANASKVAAGISESSAAASAAASAASATNSADSALASQASAALAASLLSTKTDKSVSLLSWAYTSSFQLVSSTRDANSAIISANIVWPDSVTGVFTTDVASTAFPGAIDAWHATYAGTPTKTITQTTVTRDSSGAVVIQPAIVIS